jgi:hypothetical protein
MKHRAAPRQFAIIASMAAAFAVSAEGTASAQPRWGRAGVPRSGACFYRDANFQNDYFCAQAGEDIGHLPNGMNDQISSIRTFGNVAVTVYRNDGFEGKSTQFAGDVRNLQDQGWNDRLSSIRVSGGRGAAYGAWGGGSGDVRTTREADRIIDRAYRDILHREPDAGGRREYRSRLIDDHWTEDQLRRVLRGSPERQERITDARGSRERARAQQVVRQAYLSVLRREPDAASEAYVQKVMSEGWSEEDVARELRNSAEFRTARRRR